MKVRSLSLLLAGALVLASLGPGAEVSPEKETLKIAGLEQPVEIIKDRYGVSHIFARNQKDLFFTQGFNVAADRLFQLEMWRRQATGTMAEILGPKALQRDIGARLLKYRGDITQEMSFYHPQGEEIIRSFVRGINAYIDLTQKDPALLPLEFGWLGIAPGYWTPEVVVSRHNGLFRNAVSEVELARAVLVARPDNLQELLNLHPGKPDLRPAEGIAFGSISDRVLELYREAREPVRFDPEDLSPSAAEARPGPPFRPWVFPSLCADEPEGIEGSNCWAVSGRLTTGGAPLLASDPHRDLQIPSLRYWVHLCAPGWNVIGGGEPALPGVSIGHNEDGAWGLTIFSADQEDLYAYETNPADPDEYRYEGRWEKMETVKEEILVKGRPPVEAVLKFTRHGPVLFEDAERHAAYALRAAWLQTGCAPYLSSLRTDQARSWPEFREAVFRNRTPSLNMIWADRSGDIGWQATGLTPHRSNWPGLLPVPGDGRFEWSGFIPPSELPSLHNPADGLVATANEDNLPAGYPYAVGYLWAEPFRIQRIREFLGSRRKMDLADMTSLQQDFLSLPARRLCALIKGLKSDDELVQKCLALLDSWDYVLAPDSAAAAVYVAWQRELLADLTARAFPEGLREGVPGKSLSKMISWIETPGDHPELLESLAEAAAHLKEIFGPETAGWRYGDEKFHHVRLRHSMSAAVSAELGRSLDLGPRPRGGNGETVNNTSNADKQESGATFRMVVDLSDWDKALACNMPGQSADPKSPHYSDLFGLWTEGRYFPAYFTREKIQGIAEKAIRLWPQDK
jgi:penicillin amidase